MVQTFCVAGQQLPKLGETVLLCGVSWATGHAEFHLRINGAASTHVPVPGFRLGYSAQHATPRCVGHKPFRDRSAPWVDCDTAPLHDGQKCDRCAANDATFASQLHHAHTRGAGELDASIRSHLAQENHLYLAGFRDGSIKVGTSTSHRLHTRLCEQGAWSAAIVATTTNGVAVREIEAQITTELGLAQSVSARRKLTGLVNPIGNDRLTTELARWKTAVHRLIDGIGSDEINATDESWSSPVANDDVWNHVIGYPLKLRTGAHQLEFVAASGRLCAFTRPGTGDVFAADPKALYGRELVHSNVEPDELAVQDSLF